MSEKEPVQGVAITFPAWLTFGGKVIVKAMAMPMVDLSMGYIIQPEGYVMHEFRIPLSTALLRESRPLLEEALKSHLQEQLNGIYRDTDLETPTITSVEVIMCEMTPIPASVVSEDQAVS